MTSKSETEKTEAKSQQQVNRVRRHSLNGSEPMKQIPEEQYYHQPPDSPGAASQTQPSPHPAKPAVIGSIKGHRTQSGTMTLSGSFDQSVEEHQRRFSKEADAASNRDRANTAPSSIPEHNAEQESSSPEAAAAAAAAATDPAQVSPAQSEEDEELKMAMAMALAIQQNPNLTPAEIHELMGQQQKLPVVAPAAASKPAAASALIPGRFSSLFAADSNKKSENFMGSFRDKARGLITTTTSAAAAAEESKNLSPMEANTAKLPFRSTTPEAAETKPAPKKTSPVAQEPTSSLSTAVTDLVKDAVDAVPAAMPDVLSNAMAGAMDKASELTKSPNAARGVNRHGKMFKLKTASSTSSKSLTASSLPPPRLTGIAWKRRGGMGKYSTTSAWERRRIALQGTKLVYYLIEEEHPLMVEEDLSEHGPQSAKSEASDKKTTAAGTWFENTANAFAFTASASEGNPDAPRGYIDLAKEKATVHAAFGHSGAPTPFALSIKIKAETKWKLCFDRHANQMKWLSAITDVVVQTSVDSYNTSLLEAADPANHFDYALFQPPMTADGAAIQDEAEKGKGHRLWILEKYRVASQPNLELLSNDESEGMMDRSATSKGVTSNIDEDELFVQEQMIAASLVPDAAADAEARTNAEEEAIKSWVIPEENLRSVFTIFNCALFYARTSIGADAFWLLVVFANFGMFWCLVEQPHWKDVLGFVQGMPQLVNNRQSLVTGESASDAAKTAAPGGAAEVDNLAGSVSEAKKPKYMPKAGCTSVKLKEPTDPPRNDKGEMFAGWRPMPGDLLAVRSHGYSATKAKVPSPGELYECVNLDVFESPSRYPDMATRVQLPEVDFDDADGPKTWRSPDHFVISIALPTDTPKLGRASSDGSGYTITMYYRMKQETRDILRRVTADDYDPSKEKPDDPQKSQVNAVRLLEDWVRRAPNDPNFQARFKIVPNAHNLKEIGMPAWITKYNGKPFLIKRAGVTGFLSVHPKLSCVEFDVSLHPFPYLAKQGICFMKESYFKKVLVTFGFVIEGRADDELPECLIGLCQLCYPDPQNAIQAADFFAGTAPRSF